MALFIIGKKRKKSRFPPAAAAIPGRKQRNPLAAALKQKQIILQPVAAVHLWTASGGGCV